MTEIKFLRLWIMTLVAVLAITSGNGAWAYGPCLNPGNTGLPAGECVNLYGYDVKVHRVSGLFPEYVGGDSIYRWSISSNTNPPTKYPLGHIDIEIPVSIDPVFTNLVPDPALQGPKNIDVIIEGCTTYNGVPVDPLPYIPNGTTPPGWILYPAGKGDPSVSFGTFEYDKYVLKIIPASGTGECAISNTALNKIITVTFKGKRLFSGLDEVLVKAATKGGSAEALHLLGPSLISGSTTAGNQPPLRSVETFKLGANNCVMEILLDQEGSIAKATTRPFDDGPNGCTRGSRYTDRKEPIGNAFICDKDASGNPVNCKPKTFVEQNIMDKSGDDSTYCYYTKTGQRVCKTI